MKRLCLVLISVLVFGVIFTHATTNAAEPESSPVMHVTPVIEELSLSPSGQTDKTISVTNKSNQDLKVRAYVAPYSFSAESNSSDYESQTEYTQIYHWIKIVGADSSPTDEAEFTIRAQKSLEIKYQINVPESAPGGSQHACIFIETIPGEAEETDGVITVSRMAVKIFAEIPGETNKDAEILYLNTDTFVIDGKVSASAAVKNIGNVDIKPTLALRISGADGETVFDNTDITMVFPEDSDELEVKWSETPTFGIYNLVASVNILGKNQIIEKTIFIFPSWFIVLSLIVIAIIVAIVAHYYKIRKAKMQRNTPKQLVSKQSKENLR